MNDIIHSRHETVLKLLESIKGLFLAWSNSSLQIVVLSPLQYHLFWTHWLLPVALWFIKPNLYLHIADTALPSPIFCSIKFSHLTMCFMEQGIKLLKVWHRLHGFCWYSDLIPCTKVFQIALILVGGTPLVGVRWEILLGIIFYWVLGIW